MCHIWQSKDIGNQFNAGNLPAQDRFQYANYVERVRIALVVLAFGAPFSLGTLSTDVRASAGKTRDTTRGPGARRLPKRSRSVGLPFSGRLRRGVRLRPSAFVRLLPADAPAGNFYGTWELVQLIERAAYRVARRHPGAKLTVGELSRKNGGRIPGHASHQNGRDADLSFYMLNGRGKPFAPSAFARFDARGRGKSPNRGLTFDDARNWELVAKLVADGDARVQQIFVARTLKERLLREGRRARAPAAVLNRARKVMVEPGHHPHDNHYHVRIYCSPSDRPSCRDQGPRHPWRPR